MQSPAKATNVTMWRNINCARNSRKCSTPRATEDNPDEFVLEKFSRRLNHEMLTMPVYFKDNFNHTIQFHELYQQHSEKLFFDRYQYLMIGWLDSSVGRTLRRYRSGQGFESRSGLNFSNFNFTTA